MEFQDYSVTTEHISLKIYKNPFNLIPRLREIETRPAFSEGG